MGSVDNVGLGSDLDRVSPDAPGQGDLLNLLVGVAPNNQSLRQTKQTEKIPSGNFLCHQESREMNFFKVVL
jgi:hypothetical protein